MLKPLLSASFVLLTLAGCSRFEVTQTQTPSENEAPLGDSAPEATTDTNAETNPETAADANVDAPTPIISEAPSPVVAPELPSQPAPPASSPANDPRTTRPVAPLPSPSARDERPNADVTTPPRVANPPRVNPDASAGTVAAPSTLQVCEPTYLAFYTEITKQLQITGRHILLQENPPNLRESVRACDAVEARFPSHKCYSVMDEIVVETKAFEERCKIARDLYKAQQDVEAATSNANGTQAPSSPEALLNATVLGDLSGGKLIVTIVNPSEMQRAIDKPKSAFVINGEVFDMVPSLSNPSLVRCTIVRRTREAPTLTANQRFESSGIGETYSNGYRLTQVSLGADGPGILCSSLTGKSITLGEIKTMFSGLATIVYQADESI